MISRDFLKAGHLPTLLSAFFYFDMSFMVWVLLGALAVQISTDLSSMRPRKASWWRCRCWPGPSCACVFGVLVDRLRPRRAGIIGQVIVISGLIVAWLAGIDELPGALGSASILGVAGASFAVALPLASRWYPPQYQGIALGIAGAGNSGTVFASLFAPGLAAAVGWNNVLGLAVIPLDGRVHRLSVRGQGQPGHTTAEEIDEYLAVFRMGDAWWFMFFYAVTFGGFVGLASSLAIYFNTDYGLGAVQAGLFHGGLRVLRIAGAAHRRRARRPHRRHQDAQLMYGVAALALVCVSFHPQSVYGALALFAGAMLAFGMGNGSVFQLVPQRFRHEIGVMTGLVGMTGGVGGFFLASSLGMSKQLTGTYQAGLLLFASLAVLALVGLTIIKHRWRTTWGAVGIAGARI